MLQTLIRRMSRVALLSLLALGLSFGSAFAEGTVKTISSTGDGYCHLKIPAARPSTLAHEKSELKSSETGDLIDFYGPCNYDPTGKDAMASQRKTLTRKWGKL